MIDKTKPQFDVVCDKCGYTFKTRLVRKFVTCGYCSHSFPNPNYIELKPTKQKAK